MVPKPTPPKAGAGGKCFVVGTRAHLGEGRWWRLGEEPWGAWLGQAMATHDPGEAGHAESLAVADARPDPAATRAVWLVQEGEDGNQVVAGLLRSLDWMAERGIRAAGDWAELDLEDMGAAGAFQVVAVGPCPEIEAGPGRLMTGEFYHRRAAVYNLWVEGESEPLGVTARHPIWSEDRRAWVAAEELRPGERVVVRGGTRPVLGLEYRGEEPVCNLEIDADHCYRVGEQGILVHNASDPRVDEAVCNIPNLGAMEYYRGYGNASATQFLSYTWWKFGEDEAEKEYRKAEANPDQKERRFTYHAQHNGDTAWVSVTTDKRIAWVFATDSNNKDGYIYIVRTSRAEFNKFNTKKTRLPNDEFIKEDEYLVPLLITMGELVKGGVYSVMRVKVR